MDILKLIRQAEFDFPTENVGDLRCGLLTTTVLNELRKMLEAGNVDGQAVVRRAFQLIARKKEALKEGEDATDCDGGKLVDAEVATLTADEIESFAEKIIKRNFYYLAKSKELGDIEKKPDETNVEFFVRLIKHSAAAERARWEKLMEPVNSVLFGSATRDAWAKSVSAVDQVKSSLDFISAQDKYKSQSAAINLAEELKRVNANISGLENASKPFDLLKKTLPEVMPEFIERPIPFNIQNHRSFENPAHKTNEKLDNLIDEIGELRSVLLSGAKAMAFLETTVREMQADYLVNAVKADKRTKIAERIAVVSLIVSAIGLCLSTIFSYQTLIDADEGGKKNEAALIAIQKELQETRAAQKEEREAFIKAIRESARPQQDATKFKRQ